MYEELSDRKAELEDVFQQMIERPGYKRWAEACMSLLALTEGLSRYVETEEEDPHCDMRTRIEAALEADEKERLLDIAGLHAFEYRAMGEETEELWQPLEETLSSFYERHSGRIRVWRSHSPQPSRAEVEAWLMDRVAT
ncbi:MAG: hypothetical protein AAF662_02740 [Pseudomonadota bacterium]